MKIRKSRTAMCAVLALLSAALSARAGAICERETIAMSVSPDNRWVALVREGECSSGSVTVSTDTVQLLPREALQSVSLAQSSDNAEHENDVLVVDYYGRFQNRPILKWLSPQQLQITIPNISGIGLRKDSYHELGIAVRFDPDDAIARAKWRSEHGLPPD